ncbi:WG repeat-containing protein [Campylobacter lari]|uniref:WG repeat-containing protein n=1 Tax=Campylobacter lari TaxID=201 RepID=UPI00087421D9|nr:WG repeat-containing protein [Campylobacter lari]EAH4935236.1 WG repeat-containing protein [Campylobacter lari]EAH7837007.1 WG repeat-containing protein [Campylobacter lari]EAI0924716.1 WG repeat-containing protein [Campylobacter lari]EAI2015998.1 WG repeat-containing protein [Campylobacter lari]EAI2082486.1 WG repeat-containing protein [Campylobacter lari]
MKEVKIIIDDEFDYIRDFKNGFSAVKKAGKYSFINKNGELICDFLYDDILDFSQNLAAVMKNGVLLIQMENLCLICSLKM